ncbi:phenylalanine--tRNA ligase subunit alpha [candidate division KSB1 bacterium]|nr:phenylalanine--tRNA ligase subunit alpha [candidate division KSB1 bacterium]
MIDRIQQVREAARREFDAAQSLADVELVHVKYLSRKGLLADLFKLMPKVDAAERPRVGQLINELRDELETIAAEKTRTLKPRQVGPQLDPTLPARMPWVGTHHPLSIVMQRIVDIFRGMGFRVADGPEIELVKYNFDKLNTPAWHPSRALTDTIYLPNGFVVRTETSPVQVRTMEQQDPPVRIISPGRVYRRDSPDATHSPMFHQVEGLYVDGGVTMADLKGTLLSFYRQFFGEHTKLRMRPHFFPFTEPSAEVDVSCPFCDGQGCRVCKQSGWLEMGGSGMVHPNVLAGVGYDAERYTGYAFGLGIDRLVMLLYGMDNIKLLYESDVRFLKQFAGA